MAGANCCAQAFFSRAGGPAALAGQAGVGQLLADLEEFGGQAPEAVVLVELGLDGGRGVGGDGARGALAIDVADEQVIGAMAGIARLAAAAGGAAALHVAMDEGAGAHVADRGELGEDRVAALLESGDVDRGGQGVSFLRSFNYIC